MFTILFSAHAADWGAWLQQGADQLAQEFGYDSFDTATDAAGKQLDALFSDDESGPGGKDPLSVGHGAVILAVEISAMRTRTQRCAAARRMQTRARTCAGQLLVCSPRICGAGLRLTVTLTKTVASSIRGPLAMERRCLRALPKRLTTARRTPPASARMVCEIRCRVAPKAKPRLKNPHRRTILNSDA